jgi:hypothetical protein
MSVNDLLHHTSSTVVFNIEVPVITVSYFSLLQKVTATRMSSAFSVGLMGTPRLLDSLWGALLRDQWSVSEGLISSTCDRVTKKLHE